MQSDVKIDVADVVDSASVPTVTPPGMTACCASGRLGDPVRLTRAGGQSTTQGVCHHFGGNTTAIARAIAQYPESLGWMFGP